MPDRAESCGGCRYFSHNATLSSAACCRYPSLISKLPFEWCGEFAPTGNTVIDSREDWEKDPRKRTPQGWGA